MLALRWSGIWFGPLLIGFALSSLAQLEVKMNKPGVTVRTNTAYYTEP